MVQQISPMRPNQKTLTGVVVSDKMDKTVVVAVERSKRHRLYQKTLRRTHRYKAHDPNNECKLGDTVMLVETRPLSKEKRWRVLSILQHHLVAEIQPRTIGSELEQIRADQARAAAAARDTTDDDADETDDDAVESAAVTPGDETDAEEAQA